MKKLEVQCEQECDKVDDDANELDTTDSSESEEEPEDPQDEQYLLRKKRYLKRIQAKQDLDRERRMALLNKTKSKDPVERALQYVQDGWTKYSAILPRDRELEHKIYKRVRKVWKGLRKDLRHVSEVVMMRVKIMQNKASGDFNELAKEMKFNLYNEYLSYQINSSRQKAEREFECIDGIRENIAGMGLQKVFKAWKKFTFSRIQRERRDLRAKWRAEIKGFDTAMETVKSAQAQVAMWKKCMDVYTDKPFWVHQLNGKC